MDDATTGEEVGELYLLQARKRPSAMCESSTSSAAASAAAGGLSTSGQWKIGNPDDSPSRSDDELDAQEDEENSREEGDNVFGMPMQGATPQEGGYGFGMPFD